MSLEPLVHGDEVLSSNLKIPPVPGGASNVGIQVPHRSARRLGESGSGVHTGISHRRLRPVGVQTRNEGYCEDRSVPESNPLESPEISLRES